MNSGSSFRISRRLSAAASLVLVAGAAAQCPQWISGPGTANSLQGTAYATLLWDPPGPEPEQLIAGGNITAAGSSAVSNIATYDPVSGWRPMGAGLSGTVRALTLHKGELYAAGAFGVSRWSGSAWQPIGAPGSTDCLISHASSLISGGAFGIMEWNGASWNAFAGNVSGTYTPFVSNPGRRVYALAAFQGDLIVGGHFSSAGGTPVNCIARWNGSAWSSLGGGLFIPPGNPTIRATVRAFHDDGINLYIGGTFEGSSPAPGVSSTIDVASPNVIAWNGNSYVGLGGPCFSRWFEYTDIEVIAGTLWVAGVVPYGCGGTPAYFGARAPNGLWNLPGPAGSIQNVIAYSGFPVFDGRTSWQNGVGVELSTGINSVVNGFANGGGSLYAAGPTSAGGQYAGGVARWDGAWHSIGLTGVTGGFYGATDLAWFNNELYIGGDFTSAAGLPSGGLVRYNGSSFSTVGGTVNGTVYAMAVYNNALIASGPITSFGPLATSSIAQWNGSVWAPVGAGLAAPANAFTIHNSDLHAAGPFVPGNNVVKFNGTSWAIVPGGFDSAPYALTSHAGKLYAAGAFAQAGSGAASRIASFDGASWSEVGGGIGGGLAASVAALHSLNGKLYAAGNFSQAGLASTPAIAQWDGIAWTAPDGGLAAGSNAAALASYNGELIVGGSFSATSRGVSKAWARLGCPTVCYPNCDFSTSAPLLTPNDFQCFLNSFAAGSAYANCDGSTQTPTLTANDFQCFLNAFAAGCP